MPKGSAPKIILSKKRLLATWSASRDATSKPASAGIDLQSAESFSQNLIANIERLHQQIVDDDFHFSGLRAVTIPKDSGKLRVICIPTVRDRLVQRAIASWLIETKKFPHQEFVYGIKGEGSRRALERAIALRKTHEWCVKTDIQAFFDNIHRDKLKAQIGKRLRNSNIVPLLFAAIGREIKSKNPAQKLEIQNAGIRTDFGIRQGMPLSPLLANVSLAKFDASCKEHGIKLLRYADDIIGFFRDEKKAREGFNHIKAALAKLELEVPELGSAKTELVASRQPVSFLGREIVYLDRVKGYVSRVGEKKLLRIKESLTEKYSLHKVMAENGTINEAIGSLAASMRSYLGSYKDAHNFAHFQNEVRHHFRSISTGWFKELFGADAIEKLSDEQRTFLGLQSKEVLEPMEDVELAF